MPGKASQGTQNSGRPNRNNRSSATPSKKPSDQASIVHNIPSNEKNSGPKNAKKQSDRSSMSQNITSRETTPVGNENEPCVVCKSMITDEDAAVVCDFCEHWYCFNCSNISEKSVYETIAKSSNADGLMWYCPHCRISFPGVKKTVCRIAKLEKNQEEIMSKLEALEKGHVEENGRIENIVAEALEEKQNIEERKLNVVCFGLKESDQERPEERRQDDESRIISIVTEVMEIDREEIDFKERPVRLGKYDADASKIRPVKLVFTKVEAKKKVLKAAREKLKSSKEKRCENLYFQPDLTKSQRHDAFLKRNERRAKKSEDDAQSRNNAISHVRDAQRDIVQGRREEGASLFGGGGRGQRRRSDDLFRDSQH